ncbi:ABC transporter C family member 12 [Bienertia sinuspersici]
MAFKPLVWYCQPVANGVWATAVQNALGAYTPCATDSLVICLSHLVMLGLCLYRIWTTYKNPKAQKYCLRSNYYNYFLALLAGYSAAEPLFRLIMGVSVLNLDGQAGVAPYEVISLIFEALAWFSMLVMVGIETKVYVREFRWFVRFGVVYALVGDAVMLNLVLSVKEQYDSPAFNNVPSLTKLKLSPLVFVGYLRSVLYLYISEVFAQVLFGVLLFAYVPSLDPYSGYTPIRHEQIEDNEYEELPGGELVCPERHVNIFSKILFSWMNPLMKLGYRRPLTEKDVWKLDTWDQTETLISKFQSCWVEESRRPKPWLIKALNHSLGEGSGGEDSGRLVMIFHNLLARFC